MIWNGFDFDAEFLDQEDIIAKLHLLIQLERSDPYSNRKVALKPLVERIQTSLSYVPKEHRQYVLALFANTLYFPNNFSHSVLQHLMNKFTRNNNIKPNEIGSKCLILEQDPTGIINEFLRHNAIPGRLDKCSFQRTQQVKPFVEAARNNFNSPKTILGIEDVTPFLEREYWIVLADNSLSGTSLYSDFRKLIELAEEYDKKPKFVLLIRTLATMALKCIKDEFISKYGDQIILEYGLLLDDRMSISERTRETCKLFNSPDTFDGVIKACKWLVSTDVYDNDPELKDHKKNSQDDMVFGFKGCGLTFVSSENCPSDSLPLLWYQNPDIYIPPFPRVLSRVVGGERNV